MNHEKSLWRECIELILKGFMLALVIQTFITKPFKIPSGSMMDTLQIGDLILVNRFAYWFSTPKRGDVIVFKYPVNPKQDFIKRIIATAGETLDIRDYKVYVNNQPLAEPFIREPTVEKGLTTFPYKVPEGYVFVMGDNRNNSRDSRFWGPLQLTAIKGKAYIIYWYNKNRKGKDMGYYSWNPLRFHLIR